MFYLISFFLLKTKCVSPLSCHLPETEKKMSLLSFLLLQEEPVPQEEKVRHRPTPDLIYSAIMRPYCYVSTRAYYSHVAVVWLVVAWWCVCVGRFGSVVLCWLALVSCPSSPSPRRERREHRSKSPRRHRSRSRDRRHRSKSPGRFPPPAWEYYGLRLLVQVTPCTTPCYNLWVCACCFIKSPCCCLYSDR